MSGTGDDPSDDPRRCESPRGPEAAGALVRRRSRRQASYVRRGCGSGRGDDLHGEGRDDLGVQPDGDLVVADGLDRLADLDPPLVDRRAAGLADGLDDVGAGDGTEEAAAGAGADRQREGEALELGLQLAGVAEV